MNKINARQCITKPLDKKTYKQFCIKNHNQGYAAASIIYGLFFNKELVQLMSFGKPRFNKNYQWELIRDCTKQNYIVRGGVSKLWKYFIETNNVRSCICYSYPHQKPFVNKYIENCGFINLSKAKPLTKTYFEGAWNGKLKRIDKSILERHGVDRLLKGSFGHDKTNEQILLDLGFEKKYEDGLKPQVDVYFPFGIVYRVEDLDSKYFYIGQTQDKNKWKYGYMGSGTKWNEHLKKYPNHKYNRTILHKCKTPKEMFELEAEEIKKCCSSMYCMNTNDYEYGINNIKICPECGSVCGHKKTCSKAKKCKYCNCTNGNHSKSCPNYKKSRVCDECGYSLRSHLHAPTCSKYKPFEKCKECGGLNGKHKKTCTLYKEKKACEECGGIGRHKKGCSKYVAPKKSQPCPECGGLKHKKTCSQYKTSVCSECGGLGGKHKKTCSKNKKCPECGYSLQSRVHAPTCSRYKKPKVCPECGGINHKHKKNCSLYKEPKKCEFCGCTNGNHSKACPNYKEGKKCPECGYILRSHKHAPNCSFNIKK